MKVSPLLIPRNFTSCTPLQYLTWAADASWAIASTAVLVAIPVVIEVQRETTVKVLQKQKEMEVQAMEQQIKAQSGGIAGSLKTLFTGPETSE